jgi:hypothetical protein
MYWLYMQRKYADFLRHQNYCRHDNSAVFCCQVALLVGLVSVGHHKGWGLTISVGLTTRVDRHCGSSPPPVYVLRVAKIQ